jgi:hypothetical protein
VVSVIRAVPHSVPKFWNRPGAKAALVGKVAKAAAAAEKGRSVGTREIVDLFEQTAKKVAESKHAGRGLLVMLDEAGKVLEHTAQHPERGDIQFLQELAANRSGCPSIYASTSSVSASASSGPATLTQIDPAPFAAM